VCIHPAAGSPAGPREIETALVMSRIVGELPDQDLSLRFSGYPNVASVRRNSEKKVPNQKMSPRLSMLQKLCRGRVSWSCTISLKIAALSSGGRISNADPLGCEMRRLNFMVECKRGISTRSSCERRRRTEYGWFMAYESTVVVCGRLSIEGRCQLVVMKD
jgi:hypothetical protein